MKDFFEAVLVSGKGVVIVPIAALLIVSLLPVVAADFMIRKMRGKI